MEKFIHLHVHTQYSLLDGQASIDALIAKASKDGMSALAVTDHGSMFGIKEYFNKISKHNKKNPDNPIKPILGCECYCARNGRFVKEGRENLSGWHLVVLAKNKTGYNNLIKMVSRSWTEGFYGRPRIDKELLEKYHEGIIICSACIAGEVPKRIAEGNIEEAENTIRWFKNIFGEDYYLEIQRHKATRPDASHDVYPIQKATNEVILQLAKKHNVKVVATNDVHFVDEADADAHDRLICLSTGKDWADPRRLHYTMQEWMKTTAEMNALFADVPEALSNTVEVANKVENYTIDSGPIMPTFAIPEDFGTEESYRARYSEQDLFDEFTRDENGNVVLSEKDAQAKIKVLGGYEKLYRIKLEADYLKKITYEGAKIWYGEQLSDETVERLEFELYIMKTMGFPGYFLIVQDFIAAARNELNVSVGPGRGSAAGSAVAYCLGITRIDPIKYDLLFERFLNPDRISLPDIDTDFDDDGRNRVLNWVTDKYGAERVAHIITYGTMATKSAIKDVARVQRLPLSEANRLAKLVPDKIPGVKKLRLKDAIEYVPELKAAATGSDTLAKDTLKYAQMLEGNVRNIGVHACGVIIGRYDISDTVPISTAKDKETGEEMLVTQYEGSVIEETGLIKMDFLGLKTLSIIKDALENIQLSSGKTVDIDNIPLDDPTTYALYCNGRTTGTFQFESAGMQKYLRELQPSKFEDLIAMNALYRPGPMDYIPSFIARKHGREEIVYDIPIMERYLQDTYGITVYQEQVMLLSRLLANFTRGQSDALRKAMGKKLIDKMNELKEKFMSGGKSNGHNGKVLEKIWGDWEKFASYAFNKSHATCYSWIAYQTAYLKANHPSEYMAAVLSRSLSDITNITKFMDECKAMNIQVLGPDVNESHFKFSVNKNGNIRFGLGGVKGVGASAVANIIEVRKDGAFLSIFDFVERVNLTACNKKNIEGLALAGAFDNMGIAREQFSVEVGKGEPFVDVLIRYGNKYQMDKSLAVNSLFGDENIVDIAKPMLPEYQPWSDLERLNKEKELIGIYLSAHPLDEYKILLTHVCNTSAADIAEKEALVNKDLLLCGMVSGRRDGFTKKGASYCVLKIEDFTGSGEIALFGEDYISFQSYGRPNTYLLIRARVQAHKWKAGELDFKVQSMELLSKEHEKLIEKLTIQVPIHSLSETFIHSLFTMVKSSPGTANLYFTITDDDSSVSQNFSVPDLKMRITPEILDYIEEQADMSYKIN